MRCAIVFAVMLLAAPAWADSPDISVRRLLSGWKDQDPSMRLLAKVIASAFANGLSWRGSLAGKEVLCPPPGLKGQGIMGAFEQFIADNPDKRRSTAMRNSSGLRASKASRSARRCGSWPARMSARAKRRKRRRLRRRM